MKIPGLPYLVSNADLLRAITLGFQRMENNTMALSQSVAGLVTLEEETKGQVAQLLTDFVANTPSLSPEDQAAITQMASDLTSESASITATDPNAAPPVTPAS